MLSVDIWEEINGEFQNDKTNSQIGEENGEGRTKTKIPRKDATQGGESGQEWDTATSWTSCLETQES